MYFSRITLRDRAQFSQPFWKVFRDPYSLHQTIWEFFGDHADRKRDFIYRLDSNDGRPLIYTVSQREPFPNTVLWKVESKMYGPQLGSGMLLAFMLRANPVRTKRDGGNKQHRHDVVMDLKFVLRDDKSVTAEDKSLSVVAHTAGVAWLEKRSIKNGFSITPSNIRVEGYRQHRFFKRKNRRKINISTLDFSGLLTVTEPNRFVQTLYNGIGPAKGFGCGMMMVKRA